MKSGNYLSSRQLTASTFGVKELNFCVRNGNRWILFAIITAIVIYLMKLIRSTLHILICIESSLLKDSQLHSNFSLVQNPKSSFSKLVKIIDFFVKNFV